MGAGSDAESSAESSGESSAGSGAGSGARGVPAQRRVVVLPDTGGGEAFPAVPGLEHVAELGRGSGTVVHHVLRDGEGYVLKLLPSVPDPVPVLASLRREALRLAGVGYPGLPLIREVGAVAGRPYVVMDLVTGRPLADLLAEGPLAPDAVRALAADLTAVLDALHGHGIVHGHVTPGNVIVDLNGVARLIDLGASQCRSGTEASDRADLALLLREALTGSRSAPPTLP